MTSNDTFRLLILNDSRDETERLISMLRNSGRPSRAQHVESEDALVKLLQEQEWDLLIGLDTTTNITVSAAIKQIKRLGKDIPVILLSDDEGTPPIIAGLKMGACDVVRLDEDQHLLLVIARELQNHHYRQQQRVADRRVEEAELRSQNLLDSSRDAIAYIQDGMCLYVNESFAECFGYADKDDIECMPLIDMVADSDQHKVKAFLKGFTLKGEDSEGSQLDFLGVSENRAHIDISVDVSRATFDKEPCIAFIHRTKASANSAALAEQIHQIKQQDLVTGLFNRQYLLSELQRAISDVDHYSHSLLVLEVDNFESKVQASMGMAGTDMVLGELGSLLREQFNADEVIARFGDNAFAVLMQSTAADLALKKAQNLCEIVDGRIIEVDGKTIHVTFSVGVALINETSCSVETVIDQAQAAVNDVRDAHGSEGIGDGAKLFEPKVTDEEVGASEVNMGELVTGAIKNNNFRLLYQPIISLRGSEEEYYEVLLRLLNDKNEEVSPDDFMSAAVEIGTGTVTKIDRWVILESIKQLTERRTRDDKSHLIVNISRQSLCDESLVPWLAVAFKTAKLSPDSLVFQIPEDDVTCHLNAAKAFSKGIRAMAGRVSISRFGCALNPMNTLEHVDVEFVKVDGSFTRDIQDNGESPETLTKLIQELHQREKTTVVPFVENASVLASLWQAGVHYIQGYYLQAPTSDMNYDFDTES